jgi:hypothetical protein
MTQRLVCKICGGDYARLVREVNPDDQIDATAVEHLDGSPIEPEDERRCDSCGVPDISNEDALYIGFNLTEQ